MSEFEPIVRKNLILALVVLVCLFVGVAIVASVWDAELEAVAVGTYALLGLPGLLALLFVSDAVFSPIPPDLVLLVLSQTQDHAYWAALATLIGVQSVIAGSTGWFLGSRLKQFRASHLLLSRIRGRHQALVQRHGQLGVALAALTPIPFSLTCWAAGMLNMPFRSFFIPCWLRIPRFVVYYAALVYADALGHWL